MQNGTRKNIITPRKLGIIQTLLKMRSPLLPHWFFGFFFIWIQPHKKSFVLKTSSPLLIGSVYISVLNAPKRRQKDILFYFNSIKPAPDRTLPPPFHEKYPKYAPYYHTPHFQPWCLHEYLLLHIIKQLKQYFLCTDIKNLSSHQNRNNISQLFII